MSRTPTQPATTYDPLSNRAAELVYEQLQNNHGDGNQYLVVLGLSKYALNKLKDRDRDLLRIPVRFEFDNNMAIIKMIIGFSHEVPSSQLLGKINRKLAAMGISVDEYQFAGATGH
jgi:hypothetical protein